MNALGRLFRKPKPDPQAECTCSHARSEHRSWADRLTGRCEGMCPIGVDYDHTGRPQRWDERPCTCLLFTPSGRQAMVSERTET